MQSSRLRKDHIHAISAGFLSLQHCKHAMHGPGCWQLSDLMLPAMTEHGLLQEFQLLLRHGSCGNLHWQQILLNAHLRNTIGQVS